MSDMERWAAAIVLALAAHFFILQPAWIKGGGSSPAGQLVLVRLAPSQVRAGDAPGLSITGERAGDEDSNLADQRRKAYNRYLDDISDAIHARRFDYGRTDLIGVTELGFIIGWDGNFNKIWLVKSSGRPELDKAAEHAVRAASGVVRRPSELGSENLAVIMQVKYQYDLH